MFRIRLQTDPDGLGVRRLEVRVALNCEAAFSGSLGTFCMILKKGKRQVYIRDRICIRVVG